MGSESVFKFINTYGLGAAIVIAIIYGLMKIVTDQGPLIMARYQDRKADRQEHSQSIEEKRLKHKEILDLADAGSKTHTEEQLTHHLSEVYGEFQEVNKFVRDGISINLVRIEKQLDEIIRNTDSVPGLVERLIGLRTLVKSFHVRLDEVMEIVNTQREFANDD